MDATSERRLTGQPDVPRGVELVPPARGKRVAMVVYGRGPGTAARLAVR